MRRSGAGRARWSEDSWFWVPGGWLMARKENPGSPWFLRGENRSEQLSLPLVFVAEFGWARAPPWGSSRRGSHGDSARPESGAPPVEWN